MQSKVDPVQMMERAREFQTRAYAPYSNFPVGAVVVTPDGRTYGGANVENASYGVGLCAERSAVVCAVSAGERTFTDVFVAGPEGVDIAPCGACRQFLNEFNPTMGVHTSGANGIVSTTLDVLLPRAFGPQSLK